MQTSDVDGVEALFADDAVWCGGDLTVRGRQAIREYYETSAMPARLDPRPLEPIESGDRCAIEVMVRLPDGGVIRALDVFTLDDAGLVTTMRVYTGVVLDEDLAELG
jgi:hypothetical protein